MNLVNLGLSGINAAMYRLQTAGHNLNNASTEGYNRQSVRVSTAGARATGAGFVGRGVSVDSVTRSYDAFLHRQWARAQSDGAALASYGTQIAHLNNLFADRKSGISPALNKFFDGIDAVASSPADPAARSEMLGRASSLTTQITQAQAFLNDQRSDLNLQISTTVTQINSHVERIRDLNQRIVQAQAASPGQPPNDLLDQRDQVFAELGQLVNVTLSEQNGSYNLALGNGQQLLGGDTVFPLQAVPSKEDPSRMVVAGTVLQAGGATGTVQLSEASITGGALGGLLNYRQTVLDAAQNDLGRLAASLALAFNAVHRAGVDQAGKPGADFFAVGTPKVLPAAGTQTGLTAGFDEATLGSLSGHDYVMRYQNGEYVLTDTTSQKEIYRAAQPPLSSIDGLTFAFSGTPVEGEEWVIQPTRDCAASLSVVLDDPARIAAGAAGGKGDADGSNALALAALRSKKILAGGSMDLTGAYSSLVNKVAVQTQGNGTAAQAQVALMQQTFAAQQAVSGVNLNEEYTNLMSYQEQFRAASRLIDVSSTLFDTLLSLKT